MIDEAITRSTPLEHKLAQLGRLLIVIVLAMCTVIVVAGWLRGVTDSQTNNSELIEEFEA